MNSYEILDKLEELILWKLKQSRNPSAAFMLASKVMGGKNKNEWLIYFEGKRKAFEEIMEEVILLRSSIEETEQKELENMCLSIEE